MSAKLREFAEITLIDLSHGGGLLITGNTEAHAQLTAILQAYLRTTEAAPSGREGEQLISDLSRADNLRLHLGEMSAQELRTAQAAVRYAVAKVTTYKRSVTSGILVDQCNKHPDAPHGFNRDASHSADRYVCDCEGWIPPATPTPPQSSPAVLESWERKSMEILADALEKRGDDLSTDSASWLRKYLLRSPAVAPQESGTVAHAERVREVLAQIDRDWDEQTDDCDPEGIVECLGDDAQSMLEENPDDERAHNMFKAAKLIEKITENPSPDEPKESGAVAPSKVTQCLVQMLIARDTQGRSKYGATLDRTDLTPAEWLQHLTEELLDAAGYAQSLIRPAPPSPPAAPLRAENEES